MKKWEILKAQEKKREDLLKRVIVRLHDVLDQLEELLESQIWTKQDCIEWLEETRTDSPKKEAERMRDICPGCGFLFENHKVHYKRDRYGKIIGAKWRCAGTSYKLDSDGKITKQGLKSPAPATEDRSPTTQR